MSDSEYLRQQYIYERKEVTKFILQFIDFLTVFLEKHRIFVLYKPNLSDLRKLVEESKDGMINHKDYESMMNFTKELLDTPFIQECLKKEDVEVSTQMKCKYSYLEFYHKMSNFTVEKWVSMKENEFHCLKDKNIIHV